MNKDLYPVLLRELNLFKQARSNREYKKCETYLGRAHILSQKSIFAHLAVHFIMFMYAFGKRDYREMRGQVLRFFVVVPGHLLGKVPLGNTGWSTMKLTETGSIPEDLKQIYFSN
ncbi:MAG: DUF3703 domain-containing protein [Bacteriovoracaceae bacterium]